MYLLRFLKIHGLLIPYNDHEKAFFVHEVLGEKKHLILWKVYAQFNILCYFLILQYEKPKILEWLVVVYLKIDKL